ncbi:Replication-associated protein [Camellia lanceoleosa]|uniref:Replication-associated protein n=1 Tax=Camellia lanceoleosa TaxID=1840588 RepID=A0ACC0IHG4_9ERIC|nr:Replication-associated protein [Camellia lanceoleosa]
MPAQCELVLLSVKLAAGRAAEMGTAGLLGGLLGGLLSVRLLWVCSVFAWSKHLWTAFLAEDCISTLRHWNWSALVRPAGFFAAGWEDGSVLIWTVLLCEEVPAETEPKFNPFTGAGRRLDGKPLKYEHPPVSSSSGSKDKRPDVASGGGQPSTGSSSQDVTLQDLKWSQQVAEDELEEIIEANRELNPIPDSIDFKNRNPHCMHSTSIIIEGPSRTGKTQWARSLGRHNYYNRGVDF